MSCRQQDHAAVSRPADRESTEKSTGRDQTTAAHVLGLRTPDTEQQLSAPGTPHPDPVLAARGWQTCEHGHGIYVRRARQPETDREAG